jgi:hypothetical protein
MKPWTVLVYLAGDNGRFLSSLEGEGFSDLAEMKSVGSGDAVDIVAQFDAMSDHGCRRYHLRKGSSLANDLLQDLGDTNSGDAQVLLDFITWGVRTYPAERCLLVLWNHGAGWKDDDIYAPYRALLRQGGLPPIAPQISSRRVSRALFRRSLDSILEEEANQVLLSGAAHTSHRSAAALPPAWGAPTPGPHPAEPHGMTAIRSPRPPRARAICFDDSSKDFLDSRELSQVLKEATTLLGRKVDVLGMDACLMSMVEVAYQMRDGGSVMVASEDVEPASGWPYREILATLSATPTLSPAEVGKAITAHYVAAYDRSLLIADPVTQSALDLSHAAEAVAALDDFARGLLAGWRQKGLRSALGEARRQSQSFMDADYVDLYDFATLLATKTGAAPLSDACERLLAAIDPGKDGSLVLADGHAGLSERNAHGLSIYFPQRGVSPFYAALDMSKDCAWARFLQTYLG